MIKVLIGSYVFVLAGWGLITPIIAVYITEMIPNAGIEEVGFAMSFYILTRSFVQIPVARFLDSTKGERDEFYVLFLGFIIIGIAALLYLYSQSLLVLYIVQVVNGLGEGMTFPAWGSLFAGHLDKNTRATETSIYQTSADLVTALSAPLGAFLVAHYSYALVFGIVAVATFAGALTLIPMYLDLQKN